MQQTIGFDLDNTIICYDELFWRVAFDEGLISKDLPHTKEAVKKSLFEKYGEPRWAALQGVVYGTRLLEAEPFPDALSVLKSVGEKNKVYIVSHKTKHPVIGEKVDLHEAARRWLLHYGVVTPETMSSVFFETTRAAKVARIAALQCDVFVDDLIEVFHEAGFPDETKKILFTNSSEVHDSTVSAVKSWKDIRTSIV